MSHGEWILNVLNSAAATSSRTAKEEIVGMALSREPMFKRVCQAAYDPFTTYGITTATLVGQGETDLADPSIWEMLNALANRTLTGNAAKARLEWVMKDSNPATAELLWRIISKDLRAGFTEGTINRAAPGTIRTFDVMLSHKYEKKRIKTFPVMVEPKLDGLRAICLVTNGEAKFYSRTGKEFTALAHLGPNVVDWVKTIVHTIITKSTNYVGGPRPVDIQRLDYLNWFGSDHAKPSIAFEGEVLTGDFASTTGDVRRKSASADNAQYHVFDIIPYEVMTTAATKGWSVPFERRATFLDHAEAHLSSDSPIRRLKGVKVKSHEEIEAAYDKFQNTKLDEFLGVTGFGDTMLEGAIVKPLNASYEKKRSYGWLKMKSEQTEDLRVVSSYEGEGKYVGKLGGLVVERPFKGGVVFTDVGGGFSDAQREEIWNDPNASAIGRLIEVEFHEEMADTGKLRHARFKRYRDDKDKEAA